MKQLGLVCVISALAWTFAACKGKGDATADEGAAASAAKPAELKFAKVGALGIEAEVPEGTSIDDNTKGAGFPSATVWATPTTFITGQNEMFWPKDMEAAKAEVRKESNPFKEFTVEQATGDGFVLEYTLESMVDKKPLYGFRVRAKIGDKLFDCHTNSDTTEARATATALCASLRAAK